MKELSIEEKARAYDKAVINGSRLWECDKITREDYEYIFPALKESEDERIRENIIATIHLYYGEPLEDEAKEMIAWLEKQGGQKFAWSEEDEEILRTIISDGLRGAEFDMLQINWLKSLKQRIGGKV